MLKTLFYYNSDTHYYHMININIDNTEYYLVDSFNKKCDEMSLHLNSFSLLHYNTRNASKNRGQFEALSDIFLCGIWKDITQKLAATKTAAVAMFLYMLGSQCRSDLNTTYEDIEYKFIEISND